jgi:hypothetical protein
MFDIKTHTLLQCIETFSCTVRSTYNGEDTDVVFIKGDYYICNESTPSYVLVSTIRESLGEDDRSFEYRFVYNSELYDSPNISRHFKIHEAINQSELSHTLTPSGRWTDGNGWRSDRKFVKGSHRPNPVQFLDITKKDEYANKIKIGFDNDGVPSIKTEIRIDAYEVAKLNCTGRVDDLTLDLGKKAINLSKFKIGSKLRKLSLRSGTRDTVDPIQIDELKYPKSIRFLSASETYFDELPDLPHAKLEISHSFIKNLSFANTKSVSMFNFNKFDFYDNLYFEKEFNDSSYSRNDHTLQIFKVEEDRYVVSGAEREINRKELSTFCATMNLTEAIEIFGIDPTTKFDYPEGSYSWEKDSANRFVHEMSKDGIVSIGHHDGTIKLYSGLTYEWSRRSYNIMIDKDGLIYSTLAGIQFETLNDNILSIVTKLSENKRFPRKFFNKFLKNCNLNGSKFVGDIPITDLHFDMVECREDYELVGLLLDKDKNWSRIVGKKGQDHRGSERIELGEHHVDWGKQKFKILTDTEPGAYLNPDSSMYFSAIAKYKQDLFNAKDLSNEILKYDDTINYKFDTSIKPFEDIGFMSINKKLYGFCEYRYVHLRDFNGFYEGGYFSHLGSDRMSGGMDYHYVASEFAEKLAIKYKFRLKIDKVTSTGKYENIEPIFYDKYGSNRDDDYITTGIKTLGDIQDIFLRQNIFNNKSIDYRKMTSCMVRIGDSLICFDDHYMYRIGYGEDGEFGKIDGQEKSLQYIIELLAKNKYEFSYVNLEIDMPLYNKARKIFLDNVDILSHASHAVVNDQQFIMSTAFMNTDYDCPMLKYLSRDDEKKGQKKYKKIDKKILTLSKQLKECYKKTFDNMSLVKTSKVESICISSKILSLGEYKEERK